MSYAVVHMMKIGKSAVRGIQSHNQREQEPKTNPDVDLSKSDQNYNLLHEGPMNYGAEIKKRIEQQAKAVKTVRKDAVVLCNFVVTSDADFFSQLSLAEQKKFFQDAVDWFGQRYGTENLLNATVHMDEHTPHMHLGLVPITADGRLSAKSLFTPAELRQLQTDFAEQVGKKWGLQRGQENSERKHLTEIRFKQETAQKQLEALQEEMQTLEEDKNVVFGHLEAVRDVLRALDNPMAIPIEKTLTGKIKLSYDDFEKLEDMAKAKIALEAENDALKNDLQRAQKENRKLESRIDDLQADKVYKDYREQLQENLMQEKRHRAELSKLREQYERQMRQEAMKEVEPYLLSISRLKDALDALKAQNEKEKAQYEQRLKEEQKSYFELATLSSEKECDLAWAEKVLHQNPELESKYRFGKERPEMQKNLLPAEEKKKDAPLHRSGRDDWER